MDFPIPERPRRYTYRSRRSIRSVRGREEPGLGLRLRIHAGGGTVAAVDTAASLQLLVLSSYSHSVEAPLPAPSRLDVRLCHTFALETCFRLPLP